jgi:two-component system LytT family response regulator
MRRLESMTGDIEVCGEARNGNEALSLAARLTPDVVFLDIAMPGKNGFEVARRLAGDDAPLIVFLTAYGDRALEAFETDAIDYLMKPVAPDRLSRTITRIRDEYKKRQQLRLTQELQSAVENLDPAGAAAQKTLKLDVGDGIVCVYEKNIAYVEAAGEYACVYAEPETHVVRDSLKRLEEDLLSERFYRIHRKTIVNIEHIERLISKGGGEQAVRLHCGRELAISRRRFSGLRARLSEY